MPKIIVSDFSSLSFSQTWRQDFQQPECYVQPFAQSDIIRIQVSSDSTLDYVLTDLQTNEKTYLTPTILDTTSSTQDLVIPKLEIGLYQLEIQTLGYTFSSAQFKIIDKAGLRNTVVFRYSNNINKFNAGFLSEETELYFDYRVEGGLINKDVKLGVDDNDFRDQEYSLHMLDAFPYSTYTLTIGESDGVPIWVGEKVNLIMSLSETLINGVEWTRSSGSAPEVEEVKDYYPLFVFKIDLEKENTFGAQYGVVLRILATQDNKAIETQDNKGIFA